MLGTMTAPWARSSRGSGRCSKTRHLHRLVSCTSSCPADQTPAMFASDPQVARTVLSQLRVRRRFAPSAPHGRGVRVLVQSKQNSARRNTKRRLRRALLFLWWWCRWLAWCVVRARCRPHLILDPATNEPTHLVTGAGVGPGGRTITHIQPIRRTRP